MQSKKLSDEFVSFMDYTRKSTFGQGRRLKILDLRLECRNQRLTEYSDWPSSKLDLIEQEAASYDNEADLTNVLSGTAVKTAVVPSTWLHSPSPFAWT